MIFTSNNPLVTISRNKPTLFLAGSIDLELEGNWRLEISNELGTNINYLDPTHVNHAKLDKLGWQEHIEWELEAMEMADFILLNFLPEAQSPISLVELGLNSLSKKLVVSCPPEFHQSQYVHVFCNHYSLPVFDELKPAVELIKKKLSIIS